jgi:hypothetical protein
MKECEEPNCRLQATKDWQGRAVCDDHFDQYREELDKIYRDMED